MPSHFSPSHLIFPGTLHWLVAALDKGGTHASLANECGTRWVSLAVTLVTPRDFSTSELRRELRVAPRRQVWEYVIYRQIIFWLVNKKLLIIEIEKRHNKMVDRIRWDTVSYLPFYYIFFQIDFQFLLLTIFYLQAKILAINDILSNLASSCYVSAATISVTCCVTCCVPINMLGKKELRWSFTLTL